MIRSGDLPQQKHTVVVLLLPMSGSRRWGLEDALENYSARRLMRDVGAHLAAKFDLPWWRTTCQTRRGAEVLYLRIASGIPTNADLVRAEKVEAFGGKLIEAALLLANAPRAAHVVREWAEGEAALAKTERIVRAARRRRAGFANAGKVVKR